METDNLTIEAKKQRVLELLDELFKLLDKLDDAGAGCSAFSLVSLDEVRVRTTCIGNGKDIADLLFTAIVAEPSLIQLLDYAIECYKQQFSDGKEDSNR